jgi:hypothetical protein
MIMDILAGIISGLVMGTVMLGAGIYFVFTNRDIYERLAKMLPEGISPTMILLGFVIGIPPLWGFIGIIAGLVYNLIEGSSPGDGLGSSNYIFTVVILCFTGLAILGLLLFRRKMVWLGITISIAFAGVFGWLLPLIANWR